MKIVLIGTTASSIVGFRADLIKLMRYQGHTIYAFALDYEAKTRAQVNKLGAIPIDYSFGRSSLNPFKDLIHTVALTRKLKRIAPDLVFSYFSKPCIFGTLAAKMAGVKKNYAMLEGLGYLFTEKPEKNSLKIKFLKKIQTMLYSMAFPYLEALILLNPDDRHDLLVRSRLKVNRVHVLGGIGLNLLDYPYCKPPNSAISFIFVARLLVEKGVHEYIAAAKIIKKRYPEVQFYMLGARDAGNPGSVSESYLQQVINDQVIHYLGYVDDVSQWIAKSSVFVLPSYREGFPRSTQEAMAMGRAVITTDVPGCRETVVDGVNGFLVRPWSHEALIEKMMDFIEHPEKIIPMGLASYHLAQKQFDANKVNARLLAILGMGSSNASQFQEDNNLSLKKI